MKRRSRAGSKPIKARRPKASRPKRRNVPKAAAGSNSSRTGGETEVARLARELNEAREQQTATSEVLQVISSFPGDPQPVFSAMLKNAVRICDAPFGNIYRWDGATFSLLAAHNTPSAFVGFRTHSPKILPDPKTAFGRILATKAVVHIADAMTLEGYIERSNPGLVAAVELGGTRTHLFVPMLKEDELLGIFTIFRQEVRPFTDKQIELVTGFAAQAVIAIENARLLNELRQRTTDLTERTADLTEALEQQTATSEVLQVISSSPGDVLPVFAAMLENAVRICDAKFGNIYRWDEEGGHLIATHNTPPAFAEARRRSPIRPNPASIVGRMVSTKSASHIADITDVSDAEKRNPEYIAAVELGGIRTVLAVPMLKNDDLIGSFSLYRQEPRPFNDKQIELVKNFAAQAVIAIENARLLNELREALAQQTATSEVLQVISSSPGDLEPVFATMLESAATMCDAKFGNIFRWHGEVLNLVATYNTPPAFFELRRRSPLRPDPENPIGRMISTKAVVHIADLAAERRYVEKSDPYVVAAVELAGIRTVAAVPMLKENELIGAIIVYRQEVRPFTEKHIELVTNFAAQAVIAIENARLLSELREALQQQTATADVLKVISRSTFDLKAVLRTLVESAAHVCEADIGNIALPSADGTYQIEADYGQSPALSEELRRQKLKPGPAGVIGRTALSRSTVHILDAQADPDYQLREALRLGGYHTMLGAPLLREGNVVGVFGLARTTVRPFTENEIELVTTFADQAVIAIENARLLRELRERTDQLEAQSQEVVKLNQQLEQRVADQVGEIERMGRLRRFLPPQVADLIVASGAEKQLESHRREITALFCDLRGFTGFSESSDPEDVMALLRDYHAAIGEIIIKYSGTLERYAGDGVMVVFNDPVPVEKPALQAVLMALEMREVIGALTEKWRRLGHDIGFGIGIAHGFATLGTIGFEGRFDYAAIGTVSNVASRLCDEAKPGQILISPRVLMAVEDTVTVEHVGEFALKGIRRPLAAHNVLAAKAAN